MCIRDSPKIYHLALDALGIAAADAVFVDDLVANVAAAESVGLQGVIAGPDPLVTRVAVDALVRQRP